MIIRPTDDVDIVIEIWSYGDYIKLNEQLKNKGFSNDRESGLICRYQLEGIIVDVLPTEGKILGFSNRWYADGHKHSIDYKIDEQHTVKIFSAPYFLAAKLDARLAALVV